MQNNWKQENLKYIEDNYLHMSDEEIAQYLGLSYVNIQKLRIQNGFIRNSDSRRLVHKLHPDTLCWSCMNSVPSPTYGCSWSERFKPVDGWIAEERYIDGIGDSWHVYLCPKFVGNDRSVADRLRDGE